MAPESPNVILYLAATAVWQLLAWTAPAPLEIDSSGEVSFVQRRVGRCSKILD